MASTEENARQIAAHLTETTDAISDARKALRRALDLMGGEDPMHSPTYRSALGALDTVAYVLASRSFEWDSYADARQN